MQPVLLLLFGKIRIGKIGKMRIRKRNFMGETQKQIMERRISALEDHIQELSLTISKLYAHIHRETVAMQIDLTDYVDTERLKEDYGKGSADLS
jgi:hypothetical protein